MFRVRFTSKARHLTVNGERFEGVVDECRGILFVEATLTASRRRIVLDSLWRAARLSSRAVPLVEPVWMQDERA